MTDLERLARLHGIQTTHFDGMGRRWEATPEALRAVLEALGAPADVGEALDAARHARWGRIVEPVVVVWDSRPSEIDLRLPETTTRLRVTLELETGEAERWDVDVSALETRRSVELGGRRYVRKTLRLHPFPGVERLSLHATGPHPRREWAQGCSGYHRLTVEIGGAARTSLLIGAPERAFLPSGDRTWGVFLPLYALHSNRSWGAGDFTDLETFVQWQRRLGAQWSGTLPFLAAFLDEPCDPSPYGPASRLFWNEMYVDPARAPELGLSPEARNLMDASGFERELQALRDSPLVDYRKLMALKRRVLEPLARAFFESAGERRAAYEAFAASKPALLDYARFRAFGESRRAPWPDWPAPEREGRIDSVDRDAMRYHLYAQWLAEEQVQDVARNASLYLDLPLGAQLWSYDVWRERSLFALDMSMGAPPDGFFIRGQNWGLPPVQPEAARADGHRYFIASVRHQLAHAELLRIDHIMGLHRLYWIPRGFDASAGVYVHYPAEELYAILCLESQRFRAGLVGENLGTVPRYVDRAMTAHGLLKMHVLQFDLRADPGAPFGSVPAEAVASLNTHDTPTFEGFRRGVDIDDRIELGLLDSEGAENERKWRRALDAALTAFANSPVNAALHHLAKSSARVVLVNLEDLWGETSPQNVPGVVDERPNWRRKSRHALEEFCQSSEVLETMEGIDHLRRQDTIPRQGGDTSG